MRPRQEPINCGWTRDRLPLLAEKEGSAAPPPGGPSPAERRRIAVHLERCGSCRDHLGSLCGALDVLERAAAESPVDPRSPSLWPALEARIAAAEARAADPPSVWGRLSSRALPPELRAALERTTRRLEFPRDEWPTPLTGGSPTLAAGLAAAAALLIALTVGPRLQSWRADSEARIAEAEAPLPILAGPSRPAALPTRVDLLEVVEVGGEADESPASAVGAESLAQNTAPPSPPHAEHRSAETPDGAVRRYDFDLERGVPMPRGSQTGVAY